MSNNTDSPTTAQKAIIQHAQDGVFWLTINRPKANAIDAQTSREMNDALDAFEANPELRVAVITGNGERFFSAGWDLKAAADGEVANSDYGHGGFGGVVSRFKRSKPIIAAVNGMAIGGGFEIALGCDLIIATENATFALPETKVGLAPDAGSLCLTKRLPYFIAMEMLLTGKTMNAQEAKNWGLVNKVVSLESLHAEVNAMAHSIIEGAPLAIAAIKELVHASEHDTPEANHNKLMQNKFSAYNAMLSSDDAIEGPSAFTEKRNPNWQGK